ncbi:Protein RFT1-like protein [Trichoplax sp. H2]|nr:Protein RFT1-like protein [Trichoplax sp. H2]|eukprot:RDD47181.1 Protein RFT1-like protein [Trichoplax sp. H2]
MAEKDISNLRMAATRSATYGIILQVIVRTGTFILNSVLLRYITKEVLGIVNVRLTLLHTTLLFISREAFRKSCLSKNDQIHWKQIRNWTWCTFGLGIIISAILVYVWINVLESPSGTIGNNYPLAVLMFTVCGLIELLVEPIWILSQIHMYIKLKILSEGIALTVRCILTTVLVTYFSDLGLIPFSIAFICYSIVYVSIYYGYFFVLVTVRKNTQEAKDFPIKNISDFFPSSNDNMSWTNWFLITQTWNFLIQCLLKLCLTEGERFVMTIFNLLDFGEQGIYDIVNNLGSLAARFIFLPIEESYYLFFAQTMQRDLPAEQQKSIKSASETLEMLLKLVFLISVTILVFGPILLRWFCVYTVALAVNGTTECFVFAVMAKHHLQRYNWFMFLFSGAFLSFSWVIIPRYGSVGFIWANCLNMFLRICHSIWFIWKYFRSTPYKPLTGLLLSPFVVIMYAIALSVTWYSEVTFGGTNNLNDILHLGIGGVNFILVILIIYVKEEKLMLYIKKQYFVKKKAV